MGWLNELVTAFDQLSAWPEQYVNRQSGNPYAPHHEREEGLLYDNTHRYLLCKGGEGSGKSVFGVIRVLNALGNGLSGAMLSPDLPHFKKSLWPEFRRWCPWELVTDKYKYMGNEEWFPFESSFQIVFTNGATLYLGGIDNPAAWEGPNLSFAMLDEARRKKDANALKVLDGRVRIPGPNGEVPQLWLTTTPRKHWLYEYFGPVQIRCNSCDIDYEIDIFETLREYRDIWGDWAEIKPCPYCESDDVRCVDALEYFKRDAAVITMYSKDNEMNIQEGYTEKRAQTLSENDRAILLEAQWVDEIDEEQFLDDPLYWQNCKSDKIPPLTKNTQLWVAMDAGVSSDYFSIVGVSKHPTETGTYIVRFCRTWVARRDEKIDFQGSDNSPGPERFLIWLCKNYNVTLVGYDPYQLHDMATRLGSGKNERDRIAPFVEFSQQRPRLEADKNLYDCIMERRIMHDGSFITLNDHVTGAGAKKAGDGKLRIVKVFASRKVDAAVALSMAVYLATEKLQAKKEKVNRKVKFLKV